MLQKTDLVLILTEVGKEGKDTTQLIRKLLMSQEIPMEVLTFLNDNRGLDVTNFYERVRKNYNTKRSDLYKNIVKEVEDEEDVITTLSAFLLQVSLFAKKVDNKKMFYKHSRAEEVSRVLHNYYKDYDISSATKVLKLIKCDLLAFETANGRREVE